MSDSTTRPKPPPDPDLLRETPIMGIREQLRLLQQTLNSVSNCLVHWTTASVDMAKITAQRFRTLDRMDAALLKRIDAHSARIDALEAEVQRLRGDHR